MLRMLKKILKNKASARRLYVLLVVLIAAVSIFRLHILPRMPVKGEYGKIGTVEVTEKVDGENSKNSWLSLPKINIDSGDEDFLASIPEYSGSPVYVINGNKPEFTDSEYARAAEPFIDLSDLDVLGRCGSNTASLGKDMLDKAGDRRDISGITPSGWNQASYPNSIAREGHWLYHRSHLIAHMFAGEDPEIDGEKNLITGTEYCNESGMLSYSERAVQNWLIRKANGGRVLYRVTPIFKGLEKVPRGVHIEAADVPTKGSDFHINVYCYNVQPRIEIDYFTGASREL